MDLHPQTSPMPLPAVTPGAPETPEQEAAFFFGLFLRGYSYHELRQDIEVPAAVAAAWRRTSAHDPNFATLAERMLAYRRRVLAIFQSLVAAESPIQ
ncbi:MAG: hypothetical protein ACRD1Y_00660 [Terriglobales bacterium]